MKCIFLKNDMIIMIKANDYIQLFKSSKEKIEVIAIEVNTILKCIKFLFFVISVLKKDW